MQDTFAAEARDSPDRVRESFEALKAEVPYDVILDLMPTMSLIVNAHRQVLFANAAARLALGKANSEIVGARPGEILSCVHAAEAPGGCGASEACAYCGAFNSIAAAIEGLGKTAKECRITRRNGGGMECLDLLVTAVPVNEADPRFVMVTLQDISDSKRREVLERLFFHDLMNGLSSLQSGLILVNSEFGSVPSDHDYLFRTAEAMDRLIDEVSQQRELLTMESGDLEAELVEFDLRKLGAELIRHVEFADYAAGKRMLLRDGRSGRPALSDPVLLRRVMMNMLKNALEASQEGDEVLLALEEEAGAAVISVRNPAYIPRDAQLQIFQRSFSTKGRGRGVGTYSMKLLAEKYLGGEIGFSSAPAEGTRFWIRLPLGSGAQ